jgi:hypothetical protein
MLSPSQLDLLSFGKQLWTEHISIFVSPSFLAVAGQAMNKPNTVFDLVENV